MKKIVMALVMGAALTMTSVCAAAGDGTVLNKVQKSAETLYAGLSSAETVTYAQASATLEPELRKKITEEAYNNLKKDIKDKLGNFKDASFRSFERFPDGDQVVYIGKYSKEENVALVFIFNPAGKIVHFALNPFKPQAPAAPAAK